MNDKTYIKLLQGDSLEIMRGETSNSIDAIVCDPPYELGFMGKSWDSTGIAYNVELWKLALRVLKPGGHLLAFGGSRTYHRLAVAIEDAGFTIRDQMMWIYGSGFPKSQNVSKMIDKRGGVSVGWFGPWLKGERERRGIKRNELAIHFPSKQKYGGKEASGKITGCIGNWETGVSLPTPDQFNKLCEVLNLEFKHLKEAERQVLSEKPAFGIGGSGIFNGHSEGAIAKVTLSESDPAKQWDGWGTALKPAHEPIVVARKPLSEKTVAENVLRWGTGALNIDGSRIGTDKIKVSVNDNMQGGNYGANKPGKLLRTTEHQGRFPANILFDEEAGEMLGEPSRFFYCAKTPKKERGEGNNHPTVKPLTLMRYLVRLVTPPNGKVLDPFMGSGSTGIAAKLEGFDFVGIEKEQEYFTIAENRIRAAGED